MNSKARRFLPFLRWFPLRPETVKADFWAGLTVSMLLIPQAMAYAQLAGLPPQYGLYAAFVPVVVAGLFGSCSQLHTGPVAMASMITGAVIVQSTGEIPGSPAYIAAAIMLSCMVGLIRIAVGLLRLSVLVNFVSHPVIVGFTNAGAMIIAASQLDSIFGIRRTADAHGFFSGLFATLSGLCGAHLPTTVFGVAAFCLILILKKRFPRFPVVLTVVAGSIAASRLIRFEEIGGSVVGVLPSGLPELKSPFESMSSMLVHVSQLFTGAIVITLVGFLEVLSICKTIAARTKERLDFDQELIGQGLASISGSLLQAYPVSGSFSRSALNLFAGARTGMSSLFAGLFVAITLLFLTPMLHHLPKTVLAAVIAVSVMGLVDLQAFIRLWRVSAGEGCVAALSFAATLAFAPHVTNGVLAGIVLALALHLWTMMRPNYALLAPHPDGTLRDADRNSLPRPDGIVVFRFDGRLIFANASRFEEAVLAAISERRDAHTLLLAFGGVNHIDSTGEDVLRRMVVELRRSGLKVAFAQIKGPVRDILGRAGFIALIGEASIYPSAETAFEELKKKPGTG